MDRTRAWVLMAVAVFSIVLPVEAHRPPIVPALRTSPVEILDLTTRTNNALVQTFNVGTTNQLTSVTRSGTVTVAGFTSTNATTLTVNGSSSGVAKYNDNSFAKEGLSLTDGNDTFTVVAQDGVGRSATNSVSVNLPATVSFTYDPQGNMTSDGHRDFEYDDADQLTIRLSRASGEASLSMTVSAVGGSGGRWSGTAAASRPLTRRATSTTAWWSCRSGIGTTCRASPTRAEPT